MFTFVYILNPLIVIFFLVIAVIYFSYTCFVRSITPKVFEILTSNFTYIYEYIPMRRSAVYSNRNSGFGIVVYFNA